MDLQLFFYKDILYLYLISKENYGENPMTIVVFYFRLRVRLVIDFGLSLPREETWWMYLTIMLGFIKSGGDWKLSFYLDTIVSRLLENSRTKYLDREWVLQSNFSENWRKTFLKCPDINSSSSSHNFTCFLPLFPRSNI